MEKSKVCLDAKDIHIQQRNCCLNEKDEISLEQKKVLLKMVLDDFSFNKIKDKPSEVKEAFDFNLANIIISTRGEF